MCRSCDSGGFLPYKRDSSFSVICTKIEHAVSSSETPVVDFGTVAVAPKLSHNASPLLRKLSVELSLLKPYLSPSNSTSINDYTL